MYNCSVWEVQAQGTCCGSGVGRSRWRWEGDDGGGMEEGGMEEEMMEEGRREMKEGDGER